MSRPPRSTPLSNRSSAAYEHISDERFGFASFISATNGRLKSEGFCLKSRELFFANVLRCTGPRLLNPASVYNDYRADVAHENLLRLAQGPNLLAEATRLQFYTAVEGLRALGRSLGQSTGTRKAGVHAR